jgi:hypothetical protein
MFLQNIIFQLYLSDFFYLFGILNQSGLILCTVFNTASYAAPQIPQDVATFHWQFKRTTVKLAHIRLNLIIANDIFVQKLMIFIAKTTFTNFCVTNAKYVFVSTLSATPPPHPTMLHAIVQLE